MTRFEYLSKDAARLADFLDLAQSDGLQAKGCSLDLLLPPTDSGSWEEWLTAGDPNAYEYDIDYEITELRRLVDAAAMKND